jgi:hypothetical protein
MKTKLRHKRTTARGPKATAELVLDEGKRIVDQMVTQSVSLNAFPQPYPEHQKSFTLALDLYPDEGTAHLRKYPYLRSELNSRDRQDMQLDIYELEAFAEGVAELVRIARSKGFLSSTSDKRGMESAS